MTRQSCHIADAAKEQAVAADQVANNMEQVADLIEGNLAAAREAKEATDQLKLTAGDLHRVVERFKVV